MLYPLPNRRLKALLTQLLDSLSEPVCSLQKCFWLWLSKCNSDVSWKATSSSRDDSHLVDMHKPSIDRHVILTICIA